MGVSSDSEGSGTSSDIDDLVSLAFKNSGSLIGEISESRRGHQLSPASPECSFSSCGLQKEKHDAVCAQNAVIDRRPGPIVESASDTDSDDSEVDMDLSGLSGSSKQKSANQHSTVASTMKFGKYKLSSALSTNMDTKDLYIDQLTTTAPLQLSDTKKTQTSGPQQPPLVDTSRRQLKKQRKNEREMTKGRKWFNLPATEMTEEHKNDLTVIQMRKVLDPKRFYKGPDIRGALPKYFQFGTIVEGAADFYNSRIPKKKRKQTLVDELLEDAEFRRYNKKKYAEIQEAQPRRRSKATKHMKRLKKAKK